MSAFRNLLKSDTPTSSGQGSHFPKSDGPPTTVTGTSPQAVGSSDSSAAIPPTSQASATAGPEAGGSDHVNTVPASAVSQPSSGTNTSSTSGIASGSGTAAVGETTTYSSRPLASGDPTTSVIDHGSKDPLTYKFPEHGHESATGVPAGSAATAAATAWKNHQGERMPGEYPSAGYENPYKASHPLDPRVDGGKTGSASTQIPSTGDQPQSSAFGSSLGTSGTSNTRSVEPLGHDRNTDTPSLTSGVLGAGAGGISSAQSNDHDSTTHQSGASIPSSLTTTANPVDRSSAYVDSAANKGFVSPTTGTDSSSLQSGAPQEQPGVASKLLGALGLGGAAATAASALGYGNQSAETTGRRDESAVAPGTESPSLETGPPKHYRRESIPTSAYPGGVNSPAAVNPPVGGTQGSQRSNIAASIPGSSNVGSSTLGSSNIGSPTSTGPTSGSQPHISTASGPSTVHDATTVGSTDHTSRNIIAGAGATVAAAGLGAYGLHENNKQDPVSGSTGTSVPSQTQSSTTGSQLPGSSDTSSHQHANPLTSTLPDRSRETPASSDPTGSILPGSSDTSYHQNATPLISSLPDRGQEVPSSSILPSSSTSHQGHGIEAPVTAVAAAPSHYDGHDASRSGVTTSRDPLHKDEDHTGRNTALGVGAGTAIAGGTLYAAHEYSEKDTAHKTAEHEKEQARQREHEQKEAVKAEKQHQKELEKEQKHHQKEVEKEEKHQQKELEKEQKQHQKAVEKDEKERQAAVTAAHEREQARLASEEENRRRREREAAAGVATAGAVTGAGISAHEKQQHESPTEVKQEKEKKPSIFKRIFKRRKNKDTGIDEDYSTDDEEDKIAKSSHVPAHHSDSKGRNVLGAASTGGASHEHGVNHDPSVLGTTGPVGHSTGVESATSTDTRDTRPVEPLTGMPYDPSKDPEAAARLAERDSLSSSTNPAGLKSGYTISNTGAQSSGIDNTATGYSTTGHSTTGNTTSLTSGHTTGDNLTGGTADSSTTTGQTIGEYVMPASATEPFGVIGDHHR